MKAQELQAVTDLRDNPEPLVFCEREIPTPFIAPPAIHDVLALSASVPFTVAGSIGPLLFLRPATVRLPGFCSDVSAFPFEPYSVVFCRWRDIAGTMVTW
jgi:hypothetical protein